MSEFPQRIVLVDDDSDMRKIIREVFERHSEDVVLVSCEKGEELLARYHELQPDLILLDLIMPEMNGPDVIEALRKDNPDMDIPIIFLTGKDKVVMKDDYKHLNVIGVIHKPFSTTDLPNEVKEMWDAHKAESGDGA